MAIGGVIQKSVLQRVWEELKGSFRQVLSNPVIGRELKVRVRLARSYWLQGAYLVFLLALVAFAYVTTVETQVVRNPFEAQRYLQEFYQIILVTITSLIVLIAPALTAAALTIERERRTIDLLLATPLKARDLLAGKLLGSFAFILLLLALSLPASGVCVLLGGATFGELLKTYILIAFSGMLVCALALACSAMNNHSGRAVFFAYLLVMAFLFSTAFFVVGALEMRFGSGGSADECYFPLAVINPFSAPYIADTVIPLFGYKIPTWIAGVVLCLLFTRLVLTGAARRTGLYDVDTLGSLRRQVLFLSALVLFVSVNAPPIPWIEFRRIENWTGFWLAVIVVLPAFLLLFVPWVATYGARDNKREQVDGWFRIERVFRRSPAGALPFLFVWLAICLGVILATVYYQLNEVPFPEITAWMCVYAFSLIAVFWAIGRFFSAIARDILMARVLSVGVSLIYVFLPLMVAMQLSDYNSLADSSWLKPWIFYPFVQARSFWERSTDYIAGLFMTHAIYLLITAFVIFMVAVALERAGRKPMPVESGIM